MDKPASTVARKLNESQSNELAAPVTREDVKKATFSINNGKAPGLMDFLRGSLKTGIFLVMMLQMQFLNSSGMVRC